MRWLWLALVSVPAMAHAEAFPIASDLWASPRNGDAVRADPAIRRGVAVYLARANARMRLHHNKRDEPAAQAEELRGWLIALGIEADRIELIEDSPTDLMTLEVVETK